MLRGSLKGTVPTFLSEWKCSHFLFNLRRALSHCAIHRAILAPRITIQFHYHDIIAAGSSNYHCTHPAFLVLIQQRQLVPRRGESIVVRHDQHRQDWQSQWIWQSEKCSHEGLKEEQNVCHIRPETLPLDWMFFKSKIAILMRWVSFTFTQWLGGSEWLLDRRQTAVSLNNWKR